jgi:hypothetical protein
MTDKTDDTTDSPNLSNGLFSARLGLLSACYSLVRYSRSLPEQAARVVIRQALADASNALIMLFPADVSEDAQAFARRQAEISPAEAGPVELSGASVEMYAESLCLMLYASADGSTEVKA